MLCEVLFIGVCLGSTVCQKKRNVSYTFDPERKACPHSIHQASNGHKRAAGGILTPSSYRSPLMFFHLNA